MGREIVSHVITRLVLNKVNQTYSTGFEFLIGLPLTTVRENGFQNIFTN